MRLTESKLRKIVREFIEDTLEDSRRTIFVLVGPPAIGKSTWMRSTFKDHRPYAISRDDIVDEVASSLGWTYDDLFAAPPRDAVEGDQSDKYGTVVKSPSFMTWQPLSYDGVLKANDIVTQRFNKVVAGAVSSGRDIVVDMTNMNAGARKRALDIVKGAENEFKKVAVVFPFAGAEDVVKKMAARRAAEIRRAGGSKTIPEPAIDRMMKSFEYPSKAEGFDEIIEFDNRERLRQLVSEEE